MASRHPFGERERSRAVDPLLSVLVAELGAKGHVDDVPIARFDDVEEVEVRVLEVDDERGGVWCFRAGNRDPDRAQRRSVLRIRDAVVDRLDGCRVERCAGLELQPAPDLEGRFQTVGRYVPALGDLRHVVARRVVGHQRLVDRIESRVVPVGVDRVEAREVEVVALLQGATTLGRGRRAGAGAAAGGQQGADGRHAQADGDGAFYELPARQSAVQVLRDKLVHGRLAAALDHFCSPLSAPRRRIKRS